MFGFKSLLSAGILASAALAATGVQTASAHDGYPEPYRAQAYAVPTYRPAYVAPGCEPYRPPVIIYRPAPVYYRPYVAPFRYDHDRRDWRDNDRHDDWHDHHDGHWDHH